MYNYLTSPLSWLVYLGIFAGTELSFCSSLACLDGSGSTPSRLPTAAEWNSRLSVPQAKPLGATLFPLTSDLGGSAGWWLHLLNNAST